MNRKRDKHKNKLDKDIFEIGEEIIMEEIQTGPQEEPIEVPVEYCEINEEKRENK